MDVREKLVELLSKYFDIGDSYCYNLTRTKNAFACGTMGFDDFEEFDDETVADIADHLIAHGVTVQDWISVKDRLPKNGEIVLIYDGNAYQWNPTPSVARFVKGKSKEQLKAEGYKTICGADEDGNNKKPYKWDSTNSPMSWFGQMVTHWMPLPTPPKEDNHAKEENEPAP